MSACGGRCNYARDPAQVAFVYACGACKRQVATEQRERDARAQRLAELRDAVVEWSKESADKLVAWQEVVEASPVELARAAEAFREFQQASEELVEQVRALRGEEAKG